MEKYYLILKGNGEYHCTHYYHDKLVIVNEHPHTIFWGEEESFNLSVGVKLFDVFSLPHGGKIKVVGTIM